MDEDSHTTGANTHRFLRGIGIVGLAIVASLGLAGRVHATYHHLGCAPADAERCDALALSSSEQVFSGSPKEGGDELMP